MVRLADYKVLIIMFHENDYSVVSFTRKKRVHLNQRIEFNQQCLTFCFIIVSSVVFDEFYDLINSITGYSSELFHR